MGYMRHVAILVTSGDMHDIKRAQRQWELIVTGARIAKDNDIFAPSAILPSDRNGYITLVIPPDGSKLGCDRAELGERMRERFKAYLQRERVDWVEVQYGDDQGQQIVTDASRMYRN